MIGLTKTLAKEWGQFKVNVNAVAFGFIETRLTEAKVEENAMEIGGEKVQLGIPEQMRPMASTMIPLGRPRSPEEAAGGIFFVLAVVELRARADAARDGRDLRGDDRLSAAPGLSWLVRLAHEPGLRIDSAPALRLAGVGELIAGRALLAGLAARLCAHVDRAGVCCGRCQQGAFGRGRTVDAHRHGLAEAEGRAPPTAKPLPVTVTGDPPASVPIAGLRPVTVGSS